MLRPSPRTWATVLLAAAVLAGSLPAPAGAQDPEGDGHRVPVPARGRPSAGGRGTAPSIEVRDPIEVGAFDSLRSPAAAGALHVKFAPGVPASLAAGRITGIDRADAAQLTAALAGAGATIEPLFARAPAELRADRRALASRTGADPVDLTLWFRVTIGDPRQAQALMDELNRMAIVEAALPEPDLAPASSAVQPAPDFEPNQLYRDPAPGGIDADYAATVAGGTGAGVTVTDVEYSWNTSHEDLTDTVGTEILNGNPVDPFDPEHGTGVLGIVAADANDFGVTGLVPDAGIQLVNVFTDQGQALTNAIDLAAANSDAGDVIVVEQQLCPVGIVGGTCPPGWLPVEWFPSFYDAIVAAVGRDVHVVEPAANGARDVDPHLQFPDSGAILVGAGNGPRCTQHGPEPTRGRLDFSNYGERIDLQAHGGCIWTTGRVGGGTSPDPDTSYTGAFDGTSGAAAIVAGAVASLSSVSIDNADPLLPAELRALLRATGTPQNLIADPRPIGPLPNLRAAIDAYLADPHPAPANDDFFTPAVLPDQLPATVAQETLGASVQVGEPVSTCGFPDRTVWFRLDAGVARRVSLRAMASRGTPSLAVWREVGPDLLEQVGCDHTGKLIDVDLEAGETYVVQVGNTGGGAITLAVTGAAGCDLDGDGLGDLLVGVPGEGIGGDDGAGAVNVFYGHARGEPDRVPLLSAASPGVAGAAEPGDGFGTSVACGDVDGDGYDDALVGIPGEDRGATADNGAAHIFYGSPAGISGQRDRLFSQASGSVPGRPEAGDRFGAAVALADVDGDGYHDAVVGSPGEGIRGADDAGMVTVIFGSASGLDLRSAAVVHQDKPGVPGAAEPGDRLGGTLAVGDVTGDGYEDVAAGASGEDLAGLDDVGAVIVVPGAASGPDRDEAAFYSPNQRRVASDPAADLGFGTTVALGDLTDDGVLDLAVGSSSARGSVDVLAGSGGGRFGGGVRLTRATPGVPGRSSVGDRFGSALAIADTDGSGPAELHVGAPGASGGASGDGMVFVVELDAGLAVTTAVAFSQGTAGVAGAPEGGDRMGAALGTEDVDGDGYPDLAIGLDGEGVAGARRAGAMNLMPGSGAGLDVGADRLVHQGSAGVGGRPEAGDRLASGFS